jgi:hypothetical protein
MTEKTDIDTAWAAGLYEGEGTCFGHVSGNGYASVRMRIGMTNQEPVRRFAEIVGVGKVHGPYKSSSRKPNWSPMFYWQADGYSTCAEVMELLHQHLSERRREQYQAALDVRSVQTATSVGGS